MSAHEVYKNELILMLTRQWQANDGTDQYLPSLPSQIIKNILDIDRNTKLNDREHAPQPPRTCSEGVERRGRVGCVLVPVGV